MCIDGLILFRGIHTKNQFTTRSGMLLANFAHHSEYISKVLINVPSWTAKKYGYFSSIIEIGNLTFLL